MDFGCCAAEDDVNDNESRDHRNLLLSYSDSQVSFDDQANTLDCDYKEVTPLFRAIEQEDWKGVLLFLTTGRWSNSPLASAYTHLQDPSPDRQARTWITCKNKQGETQWRQLPLHAAISYMAPLPVVQKLVDLYRDAIRSADDTRNLPLHLAFGFGAHDNVIAFLIKEFPAALNIRGLQKRRPLDCCDLGPNKARGEIIHACLENTTANMMMDWDQHWQKSLAEAQKRAGIKGPMSTNCNTLEEVFDELMQIKLDLQKTKELAKNRPTMIITKTAPLPRPPLALGKTASNSSRLFSLPLGRRGNHHDGIKKKNSFLRGLKKSCSSSVAPGKASVAPDDERLLHV